MNFLFIILKIVLTPVLYPLSWIIPSFKSSALSGKSYSLRDKGDYEASIAVSEEIIRIASKPKRKWFNYFGDEIDIWSAHWNIFYCYWGLENYKEAIKNGLEAMNRYFDIMGDDWELDNRTGKQFVKFIEGLKSIIVYTNEELNLSDQHRIELFLEKAEKFKLRQANKLQQA